MANETYVSRGPVSTLPGQGKPLEDGSMCDEHDRPAVKKIQGETDSFGCEFFYMCQECYDAYQNEGDPVYDCDHCHKERQCTPIRDIDEGMSGPVYYVCSECRSKHNKRLQEECDRYADDDDDDDEYY